MITLSRIARCLSMQCRYGGDVARFYSVAEHTVHMERQARADEVPPGMRLMILMHDMPEWTTGDLLPLVKGNPTIGQIYGSIERQAMHELCDALGVPRSTGLRSLVAPIVKEYDTAICAAEMEVLCRHRGDDVEPFDHTNRLHDKFRTRVLRSGRGSAFDFWRTELETAFERALAEIQ